MLAGLLVVLCSATTLAENATAASACPPSWSVVPSPNPSGGTNRLGAVAALSVTSAWAVGHSVDGGTSTPLVLRWNGSSWADATPPTAPSGQLAGVAAVSASDAIAVGHSTTGGDQPLIMRWNGTSWSDVTPGGLPTGRLLGVSATASGNVVAVGYSTAGGDQPLILRWDGSDWSNLTPLLPPVGRLHGVATVSGADAVAVGYQEVSGVNKALIMRLTAGTWVDATPLSPPDGELNGVSDVSGSNIWAVGRNAAGQTLTLHWTGVAWDTEASPNAGSANRLAAVAAEGANDVWAVGDADGQTLAMHWDGSGWTIVSSPNAGTSALNGVATISGTDVWAVGSGGSQTLAEHYGPCPSISGRVTEDGTGLGNVTVQLSGSGSASTTTAPDGTYSFDDLIPVGDYTITPSKANYTFAPPSAAVNDLIYDRANLNFVATAELPPTAVTDPASGVGQSGATLNGTVNPQGKSTGYHFEYGTTTAYGSSTTSGAAGSGTANVDVSAALAGLSHGTTYHFRLVATNSAGTSFGADRTFTTLAQPSISISPTSASVDENDSGPQAVGLTVSLSAASTQTVTVNYATANGSAVEPGDYTAASGTATFAPGDTSEPLSLTVMGDHVDEANETFTVALSAPSNATLGSADEAIVTITDDDTKPSATTDPASGVGQTAATLNGTVNPQGKQTSYHFEYGTTTGYGSSTATQSAGTGTAAQGVSAGVSGLQAGTTYHFRVVATSAAGTTFGADRSFTTTAPTLSIANASATEGDAGTTTASFAVTLSSHSSSTVTVQYTTANGTAVAPGDYTGATGTVTFAPGDTSESVGVTVNGDALDEADETFTVTLSAPTNATIADNQATGTITDDDPLPGVAADDAAVNEGQVGPTIVNVTIRLLAASGRQVTVSYATANGTAAAGQDYQAASGTVTFQPGETTKTVPVTVNGDLAFENDETFLVNLSSPSNATLADAAATVTIRNDDGAPTISISDASVNEGNSGSVNASFTVTLSGLSAVPASASYATSDGSATAPGDYDARSGTVTFVSGETSKTIVVVVKGDDLDEADETFTVTLSSPSGATISDAQGTGTIRDDDTKPSAATNPATGVGTTTATLNGTVNPQGKPTSYRFEYGTTTAYGSSTTPQSVGSGTANVNASASISGLSANTTYHFRIVATSAAGTTQGADLSFTTLQPTIALTPTTQAVGEGASGPTPVPFTVQLSAPSGQPVTVNHATGGGTATAGDDYVAASGTLTFAPGETSKPLSVTVNGDRVDENDETFSMALSSPTGATIAGGQGQATITIRDDDESPGVLVSDASTAEGGAAEFTITLCAPGTGGADQPACAPVKSAFVINVNYNARQGVDCGGSPPAFPTVDFEQIGGQRSIAAGSTTAGFSVNTRADKLQEPDKKFCGEVSLPGGERAVRLRQFGIGTIVDDDSDPDVSIDNVTVSEGDGGTTIAAFTVSFSNPSENGAAVKWATQAGSATSPADFTSSSGTVTMAPPDPDQNFSYQLHHRVEVPVAADALDEPDENFAVVLFEPSGATIEEGRGSGAATIMDDDALPSAVTGEASAVALNAATLNGVVNPSAKQTSAWFEYGPTATYGSSTAPVALGTDTVDHSLPAGVTGLAFGTVYHYRVVAQNATGIVYGADRTFRTALPAPEALTGAATAVTERGASLGGTARTFGQEVVVWFEYGSSVAYGQLTAAQAIPAGAQHQADVTRAVTGLTGGTTYHYRLVVRRAGEAPMPGADRTFRTLAATGGGGGGGGKKGPPSLKLAGKVLTVDAAGMAPLTMRCGSQTSGSCRGSVVFEGPAPALAGKGAEKRKLTYGRASFTIKPGKKLTVKIRLSALARRTLKATRTLRVTAVITFRDSRGTRVKKRVTITLKAPKKRL